MKKIILTVLVAAAIAKAENTSPVRINPSWNEHGVKIHTIEHLIEKYFEQPYRYNYDKPELSLIKLDQYYYAVEGTRLPELVKNEIKKNLVDHQNGIGKQTGFENSKGLVTVLPKKQAITMSTASN
ncbi:MAG: hypothetical protein A4S09_01480 [Proteobacteria bacterium SG_bin7]|nr:MAG: hypothetical protein A4S09_01480 [Proteobacteria bacterium SG_bin7]